MPMSPELGQAIEASLDALHETMQPWAAEGGYINFAERPCDVDAILPPETCSGCVRSRSAGTRTG